MKLKAFKSRRTGSLSINNMRDAHYLTNRGYGKYQFINLFSKFGMGKPLKRRKK